MEWRVTLNENAYITVFRDENGKITITTYPKNLGKIIRFREIDDKILLFALDDCFAGISLRRKEPLYLRAPFTTAQLKTLANITEGRDRFGHGYNPYGRNKEVFDRGRELEVAEGVCTELHTHFIEMLTSEELIEVLGEYLDVIPLYNGVIPGKLVKGERLRDDLTEDQIRSIREKCLRVFEFKKVKDLIEEGIFDEVISQLSISVDRQVPFFELEETSAKRTNIITIAARNMAKEKGLDPKNDSDVAYCRGILYIEMLKKSLAVLRKKGVEYVEFSYSTQKTIETMHSYYVKHRGEFADVKMGILFSFSRNVYKEGSVISKLESFRELVLANAVIGFDLMGQEHGLTLEDINDESEILHFSYIIKEVLEIMNGRTDMVLRLHAGENPECYQNPLYSLQAIDRLVNLYGFVPPQIRIGHGLYFFQNDYYNPEEKNEYARLLKKYGVIVEINATSNYTLSNIYDLNLLPYQWYLDNGIPFVLATDGAGMYLTDALQERVIAELFGGEKVVRHVSETEDRFLR